jgi:hypothetical protein
MGSDFQWVDLREVECSHKAELCYDSMTHDQNIACLYSVQFSLANALLARLRVPYIVLSNFLTSVY